jgi:hypothetical protein
MCRLCWRRPARGAILLHIPILPPPLGLTPESLPAFMSSRLPPSHPHAVRPPQVTADLVFAKPVGAVELPGGRLVAPPLQVQTLLAILNRLACKTVSAFHTELPCLKVGCLRKRKVSGVLEEPGGIGWGMGVAVSTQRWCIHTGFGIGTLFG